MQNIMIEFIFMMNEWQQVWVYGSRRIVLDVNIINKYNEYIDIINI